MPDSSRNALSALHEQLVDAMSTNDASRDAAAGTDADPEITPEIGQEISAQAERLTQLVEELGHEAQALLDQPTPRTTDNGAADKGASE